MARTKTSAAKVDRSSATRADLRAALAVLGVQTSSRATRGELAKAHGRASRSFLREKEAAARSAAARKGWETRNRREEEARGGDLRAVVVSVYPTKGRGATFDADTVRRRALAALAPLGGRAELDPSTDYRGVRRFRIPLSSAALMEDFAALDLSSLDLGGGLLHVGFETTDGAYLPASFANADPTATRLDAVGNLMADLMQYRSEPAETQRARERRVMRRRRKTRTQTDAQRVAANAKRSERRRKQKVRERAAGTRAEKARRETAAREDRRRRKEARER
jgi:hypothetical protein